MTNLTTTTEPRTRRYSAQLIMRDESRDPMTLTVWRGYLLNPDAVDVWTEQRAGNGRGYNRRYTCRIEGPGLIAQMDAEAEGRFAGHWTLTTQGPHRSSRRHRSFRSLTEAQTAAVAWAGRRFKVEL